MLILLIALPLLTGLAAALPFPSRRGRLTFLLTMQVIETALVVWTLVSGRSYTTNIWHLTESLTIAMKLDGVAAVFSALTAVAWLLALIYSVEYMSHSQNEARFYVFLFLSEGMLLGTALSADFVSMYVFYELTSLCSMPLVLHELTHDAVTGAMKYLYYSIGGAFFVLFGIVVLIFHPINWSWTLIAAAAINGIPWSIAQILQIKSFDYLGVARAMPLSTGMQLVFTTLLGALFFHEWTHGWQFGFGICALVVIIVGVACTAFQEKSEDKGPSNLKRGLLITLISSLLYTSYAAAGKFFSVSSWDMLFPQAAFMVLGTTIISFCMSGKDAMDPEIGVFGKKSWMNMSTGALFATANLTVMLSNEMNGLAVGWTLSQMNVIVATLGGLFILKEKKTKKEMAFVIAGMILIALGGILIGITKNA